MTKLLIILFIFHSLIQIRNLLASTDFKHAIQNVNEIGKEKEVMGPYLPAFFCTTAGAFEIIFPCQD